MEYVGPRERAFQVEPEAGFGLEPLPPEAKDSVNLIGRAAVEMTHLAQNQTRYVPQLSVGMSWEARIAHKKEVAEVIEKCLDRSAADYAEVGGLNRLISTVAEATGWSRSDVYIALRVLKNVEFDLARQTIELKKQNK